jgi:hypothetical protein
MFGALWLRLDVRISDDICISKVLGANITINSKLRRNVKSYSIYIYSTSWVHVATLFAAGKYIPAYTVRYYDPVRGAQSLCSQGKHKIV